MADERKTLGELVAALQEEYGEHQYGRVDMHIEEAMKQSAIARAKALGAGERRLPGMKVLRMETLDGIKFFLENPACAGKKNAAETWLLLRASGTEPLLRVYCESCSPGERADRCCRQRRLCDGREKAVMAQVKWKCPRAAVRYGWRARQLDRKRVCAAGGGGRRTMACRMPDKVQIPHGMRAVDIMAQLKPDIDKVEGLQLIEDMEIADSAIWRCCRECGHCLKACRRSAGRL